MLELNTRLVLLILSLTGRNRRFQQPALLQAAVERDRRQVEGSPPVRLRRRLDISERQLNGVRCFRLARPGAAHGATQVMYLHGGAHCSQISDQHWVFLDQLIQTSGCTMHVPLFGLSPEASHFTVLTALHGVWQALADEAPGQVWMVMGDSSGGGLALALAQQWRAQGSPMPRAMVLISPWLDLSLAHATHAARTVRDPWLALPGMALAASWWAAGADTRAPPVSPLYGPLAGLPPTTLFIGTRDLLINECRALAALARQAGWPLECVEGANMIHVWPLLPLREGRAARTHIVQLIASASSTPAA